MSLEYLSILSLIIAAAALLRATLDHIDLKRKLTRLIGKVSDTEKALKQRGELANEIAHEIKNPITAILCSAEAMDLLLGKELHEDHRTSLRYIKEYGENLLRLVTDFIDISRTESGKITPHPEPTVLAQSVESIVGLLHGQALKKHIEVRTLIADDSLMSYVDPKHFKQVLFNLLHNALKYTQEGGLVEIEIKTDFPKPFVKIAVRDNGPGIPKEELPKLFNPYQRYEGRGQASYDTGSGLGLCLSKALLDLAGGTITVDSTEKIGTSFEFSLPRYDVPLPSMKLSRQAVERRLLERAAVQDQDYGPLAGQKFLLVDRDRIARDSLARLIAAFGGMVDQVEEASQALDALASQQYDAVMLDQTSDHISPEELSKRIKEGTKSGEATLIITSSDEFDQSKFRESGADQWLEKPLNGKRILNSLLKSGKFSLTH